MRERASFDAAGAGGGGAAATNVMYVVQIRPGEGDGGL